MDYKELSAQLRTKYENFKPADMAVHFNVLDEMHANENAHTRILARLLKQPTICESFVKYIAEKRSDLAPKMLPVAKDNFSVSCLSEYVDARIEYGDKVIIIENKVKDAIDQDEQIDR